VKLQSAGLYKLCPERRRRSTVDKRAGSHVTRAISMPSVYDVTQMPKSSSSTNVSAKSKVDKRIAGEM